jgi:hypothetical protein
MFIYDPVFNRSDCEDNEAYNLHLSTSSSACRYNICSIFEILHLLSTLSLTYFCRKKENVTREDLFEKLLLRKMSSGLFCQNRRILVKDLTLANHLYEEPTGRMTSITL